MRPLESTPHHSAWPPRRAVHSPHASQPSCKKATELFLESCAWEAHRVTTRQQRKTIQFSDIITSMKENPNPESMQVFVDEYQPPQPKEQEAGSKKRKKAPLNKHTSADFEAAISQTPLMQSKKRAPPPA